MARFERETTYERWMREEGLPIVRGFGVRDVMSLELASWRRLGGRGAYIELKGMEGLTGMYVGEIPVGGALEPEKHLYDELIYILSGRGTTEVWADGDGKNGSGARARNFFEWQTGSLFAPPLNTWHRLMNASGRDPVRFLAVTSAPPIMDLFHNIPLIFSSPAVFDDRYDGRPDYFRVGERRFEDSVWVWETNLIPDVRDTPIDAHKLKGAGVNITCYEMAGNVLVGHLAEWPVGRYHKAHHHGGGDILFIVRSEGYTLLWPGAAGIRPFESGNADQVVRVDWQPGTVLCPPTGWFHQHFNMGHEPARQLALRYGGRNHAVGFHMAHSGEGVVLSVKEGGTLIEYEDEDPDIRTQYREALRRAGVEYRMPDHVFALASA